MNRLLPKRCCYLIGFLLFLSLWSEAQSFALLEDKSCRLSAEETLALYQTGSFSPLATGQYNAGFTRSVFWLAFTVANKPTRDSLVLHIGDHHINII